MDDNTEELKLDVAQPAQALDGLLAKIRQLKLEVKGLSESTNRLSNIQQFTSPQQRGATSSANRLDNIFLAPRGSQGNTAVPLNYRNLTALSQTLSNLNAAAAGPTSGVAGIAETLAQFKNYMSTVRYPTGGTNAGYLTGNTGGGNIGGGFIGPPQAPRNGPSYASAVGKRLVTYGAVGAGLGAILATVREVVQLDTELKNLQAITRTSDAGMVTLRASILDVATSSKFMSTEVAAAAVTLGQAGLSASQIGEALKSVVNLATASGSDLASAVGIITSAMGAFNLGAGEAKDVANLFTAALNNSKLTMDQLSQGFSYSANAASELGVSYEELTALLASLSNAGIKSGSTLGTGLRAVFSDLSNPSEKLQKTLARLGVSLDDIDTRSKSVSAILSTLHDAGFTAADAFSTLEKRSAAAFVALDGQRNSFGELERNMIGTAAASEAAATQMGSLANTARQAGSLFTSIASTSLQPVVDGIQKALTGTNGWLKSLTDSKLALEGIGIALAGVAGSAGLRLLAGLGSRIAIGGALGGPLGIGLAVGISGLLVVLGLAKNKLDDLTASVEKARGESDKAKDQYGEVEKAVSDLLAKETLLRTNKDELKTTTVELGERFRSLGLDVNGLEGNFDGLLSKMKDLDKTAQSALKGSLDLLSARQGAELAALKVQGADVTSGIKNKLFSPAYFSDAHPSGVGAKTTASYAGLGGKNTAQFLARLNTQIPLGENDFNVVQAAQAELLRSGNSSDNAKALSDALDKALAYVAQVRSKSDTKNATDKALGTAGSQGSLAFQSLEEGARQLFAQLNAAIPKRDASDAVGTEQRLSAFLGQHGTEIQQYEQAYSAYGARGGAEAGAVSQSTALRDLSGIRTQIQRELDAVKDDASKIRDELAGLLTGEVEAKLKNLEKQLGRADSDETLTDLSVQISETVVELYKRKASEFAQRQLGLAPGEFNVSGFGQLNLHPLNRKVTQSDRLQVGAFNREFSAENVVGPLETIGARSDVIGDKAREAQIKTIGLAMSALDKQITDAFKNTDENTPASIIRERAQESLDGLAKWYSLGLDALDKEFSGGKLSPEDYLARKQSLGDQYSSRRDEATDRTKKLPFDYSRPLTADDSVFANVKTFLGPTERESTPGFDQSKNDWSDTLLAGVKEAQTGFADFFASISTGQKTALQGFKDLSRGILQSMLSVISDSIARSFLKTIGSVLPSIGGASTAGLGASDLPVFASGGGYIRHFALGGGTRDTVPAMLTPGEFVMRQSAVDAIGRDNLEFLNAQGNTRRSKPMPTYQSQKTAVQNCNVYVVQPDRIPQLGPNDVIATIARDISQSGVTKQLIRAVSQGM